MFIHPIESQIVRVTSVHRAGIVHLVPEQVFPVDKIHIPVAAIRRMIDSYDGE